MGESLSYSLNVKAGSAIKRTVSNTVQVQGIDVVEVTIADTSNDKEVEVQPNETDQVKFLLIEASAYGATLEAAAAARVVETMAEMFRKIWSLGVAGVGVPLTLDSESGTREITVKSADRYDYLRLDPSY